MRKVSLLKEDVAFLSDQNLHQMIMVTHNLITDTKNPLPGSYDPGYATGIGTQNGIPTGMQYSGGRLSWHWYAISETV